MMRLRLLVGSLPRGFALGSDNALGGTKGGPPAEVEGLVYRFADRPALGERPLAKGFASADHSRSYDLHDPIYEVWS
jgi:hypothetical protein